MRAAIGMVVLGVVLIVAWAASAFFFMLEAWGARGMPKTPLFQAWAAMTWCVGPLILLAVLAGAVLLALRSPRRSAG